MTLDELKEQLEDINKLKKFMSQQLIFDDEISDVIAKKITKLECDIEDFEE